MSDNPKQAVSGDTIVSVGYLMMEAFLPASSVSFKLAPNERSVKMFLLAIPQARRRIRNSLSPQGCVPSATVFMR